MVTPGNGSPVFSSVTDPVTLVSCAAMRRGENSQSKQARIVVFEKNLLFINGQALGQWKQEKYKISFTK
jgi:hypothetical protein